MPIEQDDTYIKPTIPLLALCSRQGGNDKSLLSAYQTIMILIKEREIKYET